MNKLIIIAALLATTSAHAFEMDVQSHGNTTTSRIEWGDGSVTEGRCNWRGNSMRCSAGSLYYGGGVVQHNSGFGSPVIVWRKITPASRAAWQERCKPHDSKPDRYGIVRVIYADRDCSGGPE